MKQVKAKILENEKAGLDYYKIRLQSPYLAKSIRPGQFVEIRCFESFEPLLRRPFSAHRILKDGIDILYEVIGKGTDALAKRRNGELLDVIGPLGNGFNKFQITNYKLQILVAGGMGVAPLVALAEDLVRLWQ